MKTFRAPLPRLGPFSFETTSTFGIGKPWELRETDMGAPESTSLTPRSEGRVRSPWFPRHQDIRGTVVGADRIPRTRRPLALRF